MKLFELLRELKFREVDDNWILVFDRYENILFDSDESKVYELFEFLDKTVKNYYTDDYYSEDEHTVRIYLR